ncbi:MAG: EI24 domain-containing protein [Pseudomonadota bacterium]
MIGAFASALNDLRLRPITQLIVISAALALCLLIAVVGVSGWLITSFAFVSFGWLESILDATAIIGVMILALVMLPAVVGVVGGLMLDRVAAIVERENYPSLPPGRAQPVSEAAIQAIRFFFLLVGVNLLALTIIWVPILHLVVWFCLNGFLLSREYFDLVAVRRLEPSPARVLRRSNRGVMFMAGLILAGLTLVPIVNLLVPVLGTAFMVHIFHRLMR